MVKRILVPLDGSALGERPLALAAHLAAKNQASIVLLSVVYIGTQFWPATLDDAQTLQAQYQSDTSDTSLYLREIATSPLFTGIPVECVVQCGPVVSTITKTASSYGCDLILLCSHTDKHHLHVMMGSIAEQVVRYAPVPVLLIREHGPIPLYPHPDMTSPLRILVGLDGSVYAEATLIPALSLLKALAPPACASLHLIRVIELPATGHIPTSTTEHDRAQCYLEGIARDLNAQCAHMQQPIPVTWSIHVAHSVAEAVLHIAENGEDSAGGTTVGRCDILALSTHGRHAAKRWHMGDVTEQVLTHTNLPVLVVRPAEKGGRPFSSEQETSQELPTFSL